MASTLHFTHMIHHEKPLHFCIKIILPRALNLKIIWWSMNQIPTSNLKKKLKKEKKRKEIES